MRRFTLRIPMDVVIHFDATDEKAAEAFVNALDVQFEPGLSLPEWNEVGADATEEIEHAGGVDGRPGRKKSEAKTIASVMETAPPDLELAELLAERDRLRGDV